MKRDANKSSILQATFFLHHGTPLLEWWKKSGNGAALVTERREGYAFLELRAPEGRQVREAFTLLQNAYGSERIREGWLSPGMLLFTVLRDNAFRLACAESCTGGLVAKTLTDIPGSSTVFWGGAVVYSNEAKEVMLGVKRTLIQRHGAVSEEVVRDLALRLLSLSGADVALSVSGIAGPEGGTEEKPVGMVWLCVSVKNDASIARRYFFTGSREEIRGQALTAGALMVEEILF